MVRDREAPGPDFYERMYRHARDQLRSPSPLPKAMRKHWRRQMATARICLKNYFGADPPKA